MSARKRTILIGLGAVAASALAAAAVWRLVLREEVAPASLDEAVARFRAAAERGATPIPAGVYAYATSGSESISALGGRRHRYPARSSLTIVPRACGMELRWEVLRTRSTTWTVCPARAGQRLVSWREAHNFVGRDDVTLWRCAGTPWLPGVQKPGTTSPYRCDGGGTRQHGTVTVIGSEAVTVAGARVETVRLRIVVTETGEARGPLVEERWLEPVSGLPVRVRYRVTTKNASPIGDVTFVERYDLRLLSLRPRR